jgi:two-component system LytT family sensor kinase
MTASEAETMVVSMSTESDPTASEVPAVRVDWRNAIAILLVGIVLFAATSSATTQGTPVGRFTTQLQSQALLWGSWFLLLPLVFAAARRAHKFGLTHPQGVAIHIAACIALSVLHCVIWGVLRWVINTTPGPTTTSLTASVRFIVSYVFASDVLRYVVLAAVYHMLVFRAETRERVLSEARLRTRLAESRLEALEARLHPHFLFNTLNTVTSLIRTNPAAAIRVVDDLSDLLRAAIRAEPGREVSLAAELDLVQRYLSIQQIRFSDRLRVAVDIAPDTLGARVPQMLLQPIVENAVQHGIAPRDGPGTVTISAARSGAALRLGVQDDGVGYGRAPRRRNENGSNGSGHGIGLAKTRERLTELYGKRFTLDIVAVEPVGTLVTITFPFSIAVPSPAATPG